MSTVPDAQLNGSIALTAADYWEIAFIYAFCVLFDQTDIAPIFAPPAITPQSLEQAIVDNRPDLLNDLLCAFLSNALNRKKLIEIGPTTRVLQEQINLKLQTQEFDLGYNPVTSKGFVVLEGLTKLKILYALVEWQLQESKAVRTIIDHFYSGPRSQIQSAENPLAPIPFGVDNQKRAYWRFGDSPYLWRERRSLKKGCEWEIVCKDMDQLKAFADGLAGSMCASEQEMQETITDNLIPVLEAKQREHERREAHKARRLAMAMEQPVARDLPPRRARGKRVCYTDSYVEDNFGDGSYVEEEYQEEHHQSPPTRATRSSGRLNGAAAISDYEHKKASTSAWPSPPSTHEDEDDNDMDVDSSDSPPRRLTIFVRL
ncbi:hypothetical protein DM01DRAFT_1333298 [Hesseltinella vesiculosa]|uniref:WHIM1 domain-containing protein n=1 Tax=Hesseltinella vesiculosa TaxID=101127 RepID=A0A1X2GPC8_9FUNG|nr:hypothetical protein DM01DRAFT_1333298 [Hesseltinella vesiculosa]